MDRYSLHLPNDIYAPDEQGQEFPDDRAALEYVLRGARDVASRAVSEGHLDLKHFIICVTDEGREVSIIRFGDAVRVTAFHGD